MYLLLEIVRVRNVVNPLLGSVRMNIVTNVVITCLNNLRVIVWVKVSSMWQIAS